MADPALTELVQSGENKHRLNKVIIYEAEIVEQQNKNDTLISVNPTNSPAPVWRKIWWRIRSIRSLSRFNSFLRVSLLFLTLLDGYAYLLLKRSAKAGELDYKVEGWVIIGAGVVEGLLGASLAWWGRRRRHVALSSWLLAVAVSGLIVLAFPQPDLPVEHVELCSKTSASAPAEIQLTAVGYLRLLMIIITAMLCALARISIWAHGITYLDDHDMKNGSYFYGILISIRISVGINARKWFLNLSQREDWWKGQLSLSILLLVASALFRLFPKWMSEWGEQPIYDHGDFLNTTKRLLKNKALLVQILALGLLNTGVWGFIFNEAEFARTRYLIEDAPNWSDGRNSRVVGNILRSIVIVFFVFIFRVRFSGRRAEGVKGSTASKVGACTAVLAALMFLVIALLQCGGGEVQWRDGAGGEYAQPACSTDCGCNSKRYSFAPVCTLEPLTTYFSPCHAGCTVLEDIHGFILLQNCTCAGAGRAVRGACSIDSCARSFALYQIIYIIALALSAASLLMQGMVLLRAVEARDKVTSVGLAFALVGLIAHVPGHLMYMFINDSMCLYNDSSSCLLHSEMLPSLLAGVSAALALLSGILSVAAFKISRGAMCCTKL